MFTRFLMSALSLVLAAATPTLARADVATFTLSSDGSVAITHNGVPVPADAVGALNNLDASRPGMYVGGQTPAGLWFGGSLNVQHVYRPTDGYLVSFIGSDPVQPYLGLTEPIAVVVAGNVAMVMSGMLAVADVNEDGLGDTRDVFDFLTAFFAGDARADRNRSGAVTVQDFFDFLEALFTAGG